MVEVTYYCPHCGALTGIERDAYLADKCVTTDPLDGWEYADTTGDYEDADGIEFVCIADADEEEDGCGRTFYLSYVKYDQGREVEPSVPSTGPSFGFLR